MSPLFAPANVLIICSARPKRKELLFFNIFQLSHANELPPKLNEFSSLNFSPGLHPKLSSAAAAYENRSENTLRRCLFRELAVPHRCLPVGAAMLTNFNPCSAAMLQLGHIQGGYGLYV